LKTFLGRDFDLMVIELDYKGHKIDVSFHSRRDGSWGADIFVTYSEQGRNVLQTFSMDGSFATVHEAEQAGLEAGKKWVDEILGGRK
jgi:hypothetical protein